MCFMFRLCSDREDKDGREDGHDRGDRQDREDRGCSEEYAADRMMRIFSWQFL